MRKISLSVVVPCKNEENFLPIVLGALCAEKEKYGFIKEIILIDNLSTDSSVEVAESYGVKAYSCDGNISRVRNFGAAKTNGDFLCFIDADVEVKSGWSAVVADCIEKEQTSANNAIFGNIYNLPDNPTWVEAVWYKSLVGRGEVKYINGGNMVVHRSLFERLSGFDTGIITGEDFDLCDRAVKSGAAVILEPKIDTIHHGYPKTIGDFFNRERWHGLGTLFNLKDPYKSKSFLLSAFTLLLPFVLVISAFFLDFQLILIVLVALYGVSLLACAIRLGSFFSVEPLQLNILFIVYSLARSRAIVDLLTSSDLSARYREKKAQP